MPLFFSRTVSDLPRDWVHRMKRSMASLIPRFCSHRMVRNYIDEAYLMADDHTRRLAAEGYGEAQALATWRAAVEQHWPEVKVTRIEVDKEGDLLVGDQLAVRATIDPGSLSADDIRVEVYSGSIDSKGNFYGAKGTVMQLEMSSDPHQPHFTAVLFAPQSGYFGFTVRVFPNHEQLPNRYATYRITWAD